MICRDPRSQALLGNALSRSSASQSAKQSFAAHMVPSRSLGTSCAPFFNAPRPQEHFRRNPSPLGSTARLNRSDRVAPVLPIVVQTVNGRKWRSRIPESLVSPGFQHRKKRLLRDFDLAELLHAFLAFPLLGPELALPGNVAAVAFGGNIFSQSLRPGTCETE